MTTAGWGAVNLEGLWLREKRIMIKGSPPEHLPPSQTSNKGHSVLPCNVALFILFFFFFLIDSS